VIEEATGEMVVEVDEGCTVALDPSITEPLRLEGVARELVNRIQRLRRESGLEVSDRIELGLFSGDADVQRAIAEHGAYIAAETLAVDLAHGAAPDPRWSSDARTVDVDGTQVWAGLRRA
jgi:isoleucyl-tRNA synthetase